LGLFDFLKKKKQDKSKYTVARGSKWYDPLFNQYGDDIYKSIVVQQAINCIVRECKKLQPQHVLRIEGRAQAVYDNIQSVLDNPNPLMTTTDFIEKVIWLLYFNYNSFIIPYYEGDELISLYPIQPIEVLFLQDSKNELYVKFRFENQLETILKYEDIIHLKYNYSINEFMGGDNKGQPDNEALLNTLKLNGDLLSGIAKALKSSYTINGIVKYNSLIDNGKTEAALKELTTALNNNENGFLAMDLKGDFTPFSKQIQLVDKDTLDFVDSQILRFFGVPLSILSGDYTKAQYEAFYQKTLEPIITCLNQSFTKCLFNGKQRKKGHAIVFNHKELEFMTTAEKIQWMTLASNVGAITINEMRSIIGFPIFEDEELGNTPVMSKNYGDALSIKDVPSTTGTEAQNG
jgi:HK97 family phage portal protein